MRGRSLLGGCLALAVVVALTVGVPIVLAVAIGNPWPGRNAVELGDQSALVVGLLAALAWVLWVRFAIAVVVEAIRQWPEHRVVDGGPPTIGELAPPPEQRRGVGALAAALVAAVLAMLPLATVPSIAVADAPLPPRPAPSAAVVLATSSPHLAPPSVPAAPRQSAATVTVQRGDTLFGLARAHLGDASRWREIFELNRDVAQRDGQRMTSPSLIQPGWMLVLPSPGTTEGPPGGSLHVVAPGESYWSIAEDDLRGEGLDPAPGDVLERTEWMIRSNAPRLGHDDPHLIVPGEQLAMVPDVAEVPAVEVPGAGGRGACGRGAGGRGAGGRSDRRAAGSGPGRRAGRSAGPSVARLRVLGSRRTAHGEHRATGGRPTRAAADRAMARHRRRRADVRRRVRPGAGPAPHFAARAAPRGARPRPPTEREVATQRALGGPTPALRMARLDVAVRAAGALADHGAAVVSITLATDGTIRLRPTSPALPGAPWRIEMGSDEWILPASVDIGELASRARGPFPCPALVPMGSTEHGELFVDLEQLGVLAVDDPHGDGEIARHVVASLAVSPFAMGATMITVGVAEPAHLGYSGAEMIAEPRAALIRAMTVASSTSAAVGEVESTFALRARSDGETWDPAIVVLSGADLEPELCDELVASARPGRGLAVFVDRPVVGARFTVSRASGGWVLDPLGTEVAMTGLSCSDVEAVAEVIAAACEPLIEEPIPLVDAAGHEREITGTSPDYVEQDWSLLVQTLGHMGVVTADGVAVAFERSKALELVVWLGFHRRHATRGRPRAGLWELDVRDATFHNVISDARRAMARVIEPPEGDEWIGRSSGEPLPLHPLVVTDADLLQSRLDAARRCTVHDAIDVLRPGLELVCGMPFSGTVYSWADAEGFGSALALLVTTAASELAGWFLQVGDVEGVFWATGVGLSVIAGHEELIALRMRAHAGQGDMAGVRNEWAAYERALNADLWAGECEPAPKLVALRRKLLSAGGERAS